MVMYVLIPPPIFSVVVEFVHLVAKKADLARAEHVKSRKAEPMSRIWLFGPSRISRIRPEPNCLFVLFGADEPNSYVLARAEKAE